MASNGSLRAGRLLTQPLRREMLDFIEAPLADHAAETGRRIASLLEMLMRSHAEPEAPDLRLLRAESLIAEHFADPEFDADAVARRLAVSTRHLNRLFEPHGCTATQWIWRARLEATRRMLADPMQAAEAVGEVALRCGFATQAHFARVFKDAYGVTPSEYRRAGTS